MKLRRIVVGDHPVSDPRMGPMDWTSSDAEFEEVRYQLPAPSAENTIELGTPARAKVSVGE